MGNVNAGQGHDRPLRGAIVGTVCGGQVFAMVNYRRYPY